MKSNSEGLVIDGVVGYIDRDNIDTDQIIPTEYLKSIKKFGFEDYLFDGWRYKDDGKLGVTKDERIINNEFILNIKPYDKTKILLTRDNFHLKKHFCYLSKLTTLFDILKYLRLIP